MAIYHLSMQVISRSSGRSVVAAAAYRSGDLLHDERTGEEKFYSREVQPENHILAPSNSPEWVYNRERLWNEVEHAEKRKDAQLCREMNIALPRELSKEQQKELIKEYVQEQFVNKGMVADIAIHRDDANNPHAHVMLTMRTIDQNGFGKKNRDWNDRGQLEEWREQWSTYANRSLEKAQVNERITHLSHEARGIEQLPQIHLGHKANAMEERGIETEKGNFNREVKRVNAEIIDLNKEREVIKKRIQERKQNQEQPNRLTPQEKTVVAAAARYVKTNDLQLSDIEKRMKQIEAAEKKLLNREKQLTDKEYEFNSASQTVATIERLEKKVEEPTWGEKLTKPYRDNVSSLKARKEDLLKQGFADKEDFRTKLATFEQIKQQDNVQISKTRQALEKEKECLRDATKALENRVVRDVQAQYPDWKGKDHLDYQSAKVIQDYNQRAGKIVPIEAILKESNDLFKREEGFEKKINTIDDRTRQLKTAKEYLEKYEKALEKVNSYNFVTRKTKSDEYQKDIKELDRAKGLMEKIGGIKDREDYMQQMKDHRMNEAHLPNLQKQVADLQPAINGVKGVFNVIDRITKQAEREQQKAEWQRQHAHTNRKTRTNQRAQGQGYDHER